MNKLAPAVRAIERAGILLVYPIANRDEPKSLWSELHPRKEMKWSWDEGADSEVGELWHLRAGLAESGKVVYAKWFRGRATFFSKPVFTAMLRRLRHASRDPTSNEDLERPLSGAPDRGMLEGLGAHERELLDVLEENSPVSTKELRRTAMTSGRFQKRTEVDRSLRALWERLLIVGVGEVPDGAFPSLSVGATSLVFEPLWVASGHADREAEAALVKVFARASLFEKQFDKTLAKLRAAQPR